MLACVLVLVAALALREFYLEHWLGRSMCIRRQRKGLTTVEVRRRVAMERLPSSVSDYPVPREERILVKRLAGVVLWHREVSVGLPLSACEHLQDVTAQEFDRAFPSWLRLKNAN